jgi:hypothetical protein
VTSSGGPKLEGGTKIGKAVINIVFVSHHTLQKFLCGLTKEDDSMSLVC